MIFLREKKVSTTEQRKVVEIAISKVAETVRAWISLNYGSVR